MHPKKIETNNVMNSKCTFARAVFTLALLAATTSQLSAAGFQLNAQSATGLGRAFAGDAVIADNASVMARNAAAMALFEKTSLSFGLNVLESSVEVSNAKYRAITIPDGGEVDSNYGNAGDTSYAPNIHLIVPLNEKIAVGINLYSNFGTKTEFDSSFVATEYGELTDIKSLNLGLSSSYRLNQQWSVGAGLDLIYGVGELQRTTSSYLGSQPALQLDADGFALGFNLGTVYEFNDNNRFGLAYRYSPKLEVEGDITYATSTIQDDTLFIPLPDMLEFSGYHRLTDSMFAVHYSIQWIGWSSFKTLDSKGHGTLNDYQWKDTLHYSIGGTYYLNNKWTLRAGYMYDQSAQDKITSISVPDSNRQWFSAGFSYQLNEKSNVDLGATYLVGEDVGVDESTYVDDTEISNIRGVTHPDAILMAIQYSHDF